MHDERRRRGVPLSELDEAVTKVSGAVIGACIEVHKALGPGYGRDVYLNAVVKLVQDEGHNCEIDKSFDVTFGGEKVGEVVADLFVDGKFIVKLMAEHTEIGSQPRYELRAQLKAADVDLGNIINFGEKRLKDGLVRVLNTDKLDLHRDDED